MDFNLLAEGLLQYLYLLILLTFHEFGHAWTAHKCGDDTARSLGRVSLNPMVHIDLFGTVILPLLTIAITVSTGSHPLLFGWAKPVPVNTSQLRWGRLGDSLVTLAGPAINFALAFLLVLAANAGEKAGWVKFDGVCADMARLSLVLCFFNLIPVPPLDGSHLLKNLIRMREETFLKFSQYGFFIILVLIQIPGVQGVLALLVIGSLKFMDALSQVVIR